MKNKRIDLTTAFYVDTAIKMRDSNGLLAAARFLDKNKVPLEIAVRVVAITEGNCREIPPTQLGTGARVAAGLNGNGC